MRANSRPTARVSIETDVTFEARQSELLFKANQAYVPRYIPAVLMQRFPRSQGRFLRSAKHGGRRIFSFENIRYRGVTVFKRVVGKRIRMYVRL